MDILALNITEGNTMVSNFGSRCVTVISNNPKKYINFIASICRYRVSTYRMNSNVLQIGATVSSPERFDVIIVVGPVSKYLYVTSSLANLLIRRHWHHN